MFYTLYEYSHILSFCKEISPRFSFKMVIQSHIQFNGVNRSQLIQNEALYILQSFSKCTLPVKMGDDVLKNGGGTE